MQRILMFSFIYARYAMVIRRDVFPITYSKDERRKERKEGSL